jgi:hypothetical protein
LCCCSATFPSRKDWQKAVHGGPGSGYEPS